MALSRFYKLSLHFTGPVKCINHLQEIKIEYFYHFKVTYEI